jgi:hypothetical protein
MEIPIYTMISSNTTELRSDLHRYVDRLDDKFLAIVHSMVDAYIEQQNDDPIIGYSVEGVPMYASVAKREYKARVEAVDRGEFITFEDLVKESSTWLAEDTK